MQMLAPIVMVAGVVVLGFFLTISIRGKIARRSAAELSPRERIDEIKSRARGRDDLDSMLAEMVESGRRVCAQIDARAERLEQLIRHADERLDLLDQAERDPAPVESPEVERRTASPVTTTPPVPTPEPHAQAPPDAPSSDPLTRAVYRLADDGLGPREIAQQLDEHVGKVDLILALRVR